MTVEEKVSVQRRGREPVIVLPDDARYDELVTGVNQRWVARPAEIRLLRSTDQVVSAVADAVRNGRLISVRSGGHCLADLVCRPEVESILDLSLMSAVYYDRERNAFAVEAGATLLNAYDSLYKGWGVTIPGGSCYSVGAGGHVVGGGYGLLSRRHGLSVDHLYAVEVVVVDAAGRAKAVVATREPDDPHRDLWWAHTGGGGGNFGIVTRYWFRSQGTAGCGAEDQLPRPPEEVLLSAVGLPWSDLTERGFARLVANIGSWYERNGGPDSRYTALGGAVSLGHRSNGMIGILTQVDAGVPDAERLLDEYLTALTDGVHAPIRAATTSMGEFGAMPHFATPMRLPWLRATRYLGTSVPAATNPAARSEYHSAYYLNGIPESQVGIMYRYLNDPSLDNPLATVVVNPLGGRISAVAPQDTAVAQRGALFKLLFQCQWTDAADDAPNIKWARDFYRAMYADTGNVPVPNGVTDGCYINYPDTGIYDPDANTSGLSWPELYYGVNHPRLRAVKKKWDPTGFFRQPQGIEPP